MNSITFSTLPASSMAPGHVSRWREWCAAQPHLAHPQMAWEWGALINSVMGDVEVGLIHQDSQIAGFLPFQRRGRRGYPLVRELTDMHGLVSGSGLSVDLRAMIRTCGLTSWRFDHLPCDQQNFTDAIYERDEAFLIELDGSVETWWQNLRLAHPGWSTQLQRKRRKLVRELGSLHFEWHNSSAEHVQRLLDWKRHHLARLGQRDIFGQSWAQQLVAATANTQSDTWRGVLCVLSAGSQPIAMLLGQWSGHHFNAWIPTFHPAYARYSPGALMFLELVPAAVGHGIRVIDLGRGKNLLKQTLATKLTPLGIGVVTSIAWSHYLHAASYGLRQFVRRSKTIRQSLAFGRNWWSRRHQHHNRADSSQ